MVSVVINVIIIYNWLGSLTALHWHRLETAVFAESAFISKQHPLHSMASSPSTGDILCEWKSCLKMWRPLVLHQETHFQIEKRVHNICWKPLELRVSLVSLQKLPCLHSSHSASATICEQHLEADFSKWGSAATPQPVLPISQLSRICCYSERDTFVPSQSLCEFCRLAPTLSSSLS